MASSTRTLVFPLTNRSVRQVFDYDTGTAVVRFMYDSGARIPVWCADEALFLRAFPNAMKSEMMANITGFGVGTEKASVFIIPRFELSIEDRVFAIRNLPVVILLKPQIGCDFILSETMVSKIDTFTYRRAAKELHMIIDKDEYICTSRKLDGELLDLSIWSQDI